MTELDTVRTKYIQAFLKQMDMPHEAWIWETAFRGLEEEFEKIETKYIVGKRPKLLKDLYNRQEGHEHLDHN